MEPAEYVSQFHFVDFRRAWDADLIASGKECLRFLALDNKLA